MNAPWSPFTLGGLGLLFDADETQTLVAGSATITCVHANAAGGSVTIGPTTLTEGVDFSRGATDADCAANLAAALVDPNFTAVPLGAVVTLTHLVTTFSSASAAALSTDAPTGFVLGGNGYVVADNAFYPSVPSWRDEGPDSVNMDQATVADQMLWRHNGITSGIPGMHFDGVSDFGTTGVLPTTLNMAVQGWVVAFAYKTTANLENADYLYADRATPNVRLFRSGGNMLVDSTNTSYSFANMLGTHVVIVVYNNANSAFYVDGGAPKWVGTPGGVATGFRLGAPGNFFFGDYRAFMTHYGVLGAANLNNLGRWLAERVETAWTEIP